jgi:hypothetical protein
MPYEWIEILVLWANVSGKLRSFVISFSQAAALRCGITYDNVMRVFIVRTHAGQKLVLLKCVEAKKMTEANKILRAPPLNRTRDWNPLQD